MLSFPRRTNPGDDLMPWSAKSATKHDKAAKSPTAKKQWADVANKVLAKTGDEGRAVREANAVVKRRKAK